MEEIVKFATYFAAKRLIRKILILANTTFDGLHDAANSFNV